MNIEFFNKEKQQYNLSFLSQELRMFMPEITNNFVKDKNKQDEIYVLMSVTTKVVLSWIIISNTQAREI